MQNGSPQGSYGPDHPNPVLTGTPGMDRQRRWPRSGDGADGGWHHAFFKAAVVQFVTLPSGQRRRRGEAEAADDLGIRPNKREEGPHSGRGDQAAHGTSPAAPCPDCPGRPEISDGDHYHLIECYCQSAGSL